MENSPLNSSSVRFKHITGVDVLRFLAAMLVVVFHLGGHAEKRLVESTYMIGWTSIGWIGVQIFFVISGFVIAFSGEKSRASDFVISRIVRLGPGVWICASLHFFLLSHHPTEP